MGQRRPLWREPVAYVVVPLGCAGMSSGIGELLHPDAPWQEQAIQGGVFGLVMVLVAGFQEWRHQKRQ